ncbi:hypothetical protein RR48_13893 [Papilio machaon]|uniref:Uncharacterized protein n=1 Tax=Papilio machaon TaxID=76193 RepID=A0A194RHJ0_PAPMA|nr:hypothetical protein RR48_13893 [Papilio machaon]
MSIRGVQDGSRSPRIVTDSFFDDEDPDRLPSALGPDGFALTYLPDIQYQLSYSDQYHVQRIVNRIEWPLWGKTSSDDAKIIGCVSRLAGSVRDRRRHDAE